MKIDFTLLFISLAIANAFVSVFRGAIFQRKPFNCVKCLTGWTALILGLCCYQIQGVWYLPAGLFVGGLYEEVRMRWL